jgi:hypothetical protein
MKTLDKVRQELERLGAELREPLTTEEVLAKVEPPGQLVEVSQAIRTFASINWPDVPYRLPDVDDSDERREVHFYGADESIVRRGEYERFVFYRFGNIPDVGMELGFNLFDTTDDPLVYCLRDAQSVVDAVS